MPSRVRIIRSLLQVILEKSGLQPNISKILQLRKQFYAKDIPSIFIKLLITPLFIIKIFISKKFKAINKTINKLWWVIIIDFSFCFFAQLLRTLFLIFYDRIWGPLGRLKTGGYQTPP